MDTESQAHLQPSKNQILNVTPSTLKVEGAMGDENMYDAECVVEGSSAECNGAECKVKGAKCKVEGSIQVEGGFRMNYLGSRGPQFRTSWRSAPTNRKHNTLHPKQ